MSFSTATKRESQIEIIDHKSVIEEIDVWLKETDVKGKICFDVTNESLNKIVFLFL